MLAHAGLARDEPAEHVRGARKISLHPELRIAWVLWSERGERGQQPETLRHAPGWIGAVEFAVANVLASLFS